MRLALSSECDSLTHGAMCLRCARTKRERHATILYWVIAGGSSSLPLYEYKCEKCGHQFEKIEGHTASETKKCPKCGAKARRMLSKAAIQFKGSGWYVTDYGKKNSSPASGEKSGDGGTSKSEEKSAESKSNDSKSSESKSSESKPSDSKSSESKSTDSKSSSEKGTKRKK
jgi:putative FmdB family regulatory protein